MEWVLVSFWFNSATADASVMHFPTEEQCRIANDKMRRPSWADGAYGMCTQVRKLAEMPPSAADR